MIRPVRQRPASLAAALLTLAAILLLAACSHLPAPRSPSPSDTPRVLVVLPPGPPSLWRRHAVELAAAHGLYVYQAWEMESLEAPCIVYGLPPGESLERIVSRLRGDPRVDLAQPVQGFRVLGSGAANPARGDPYSHLQHAATALRVPEAHRWSTGRGVTVALIDTGVDVSHPDLAGRVVGVANFVGRGLGGRRGFSRDVHGTAVAGVVAAVAGNGLGIAGVAPEARLLAYKACWPTAPQRDDAVCDSYTLAQAVDAAVSGGAQVLNLSLTGPRDPLLSRLLTVAVEGGAAVVAAADDERSDLGFPASLPGVIAVRAAGDGDLLSAEGTGTRRGGGSPPSLSAPGTDVLTTVPGGAFDFFSGSSMAAAHVSGLAALLLERAPELTPGELARRLADSARMPRGASAVEHGEGARIVNACQAMATLLEMPDACPGTPRRAR